MTTIARLLTTAALLTLSACGAPDSRNGIDAACSVTQFEGNEFTLCRAQPGKHDLMLVNKGDAGAPMRGFDTLDRRLGDRFARLAFAMNAGMFDGKGLPIGYYVEDGAVQAPLNRRSGPGNFHLKPNGVFYGDARGWHVVTTEQFAAGKPDHVRFATQSGPMLVIGGKLHPQFADNGVSLQMRNGVGVSPDGSAWFAISNEPVSFGRFARLFRDRVKAPDALYLDGSVSRLWDPVSGRKDSGAEIGPIIVALQRK
ncbi:phosphodiester glycosidase family protein [Sphingomonas sp. HF-S3]|uniref:Phosphodiester glycosidase family protein n=1 Tax=Sphingomonas rustica TaxID=3103142 RepID=A0ABV0B3Y9_9SPHN